MRRCAIWLVLGCGGIGSSATRDPPQVSTRPVPEKCPPEHVVRATILSDRVEQMLAVMRSAHSAAAPTTCIIWELFTADEEELERLVQSQPFYGESGRHAVHTTALAQAEMALEEAGVTPVWMRPGFKKGILGEPRRTLWSLREPPSDSDPKHSHPLNLLRFYLPLLPNMQHERVLLLDDDVCIQRDLLELYMDGDGATQPFVDQDALSPVLIASCQMFQYDSFERRFQVLNGQYTYADTPFLGTVGGPAGYPLCQETDESEEELEVPDQDCDPSEKLPAKHRACAPSALEPKLTQLHNEISGSSAFRNETAWNFGVALIHLQRWRVSGISRRFERWFDANEHFAFFAPTSVSFGLGLAYLALAGQVDCWPEGTVIDGLGFLTWDELLHSGIEEEELQVRMRA
jgi:hypothetical protein